jgi:hypothetical protein
MNDQQQPMVAEPVREAMVAERVGDEVDRAKDGEAGLRADLKVDMLKGRTLVIDVSIINQFAKSHLGVRNPVEKVERQKQHKYEDVVEDLGRQRNEIWNFYPFVITAQGRCGKKAADFLKEIGAVLRQQDRERAYSSHWRPVVGWHQWLQRLVATELWRANSKVADFGRWAVQEGVRQEHPPHYQKREAGSKKRAR